MFLAVAESHSFSEAARGLFIDHSVICRWMQRLEINLGTQLFERYNKGVLLTPDGEYLYNELKPVYTKLNNSISAIKRKKSESPYVFNIGCLDTEEVLTAFNDSVFKFRKLYPDMLLKVGLYSFDELRRLFINEELDFAVSYYMGFGDYKDTKFRILKEKPSYFVLSKNSPAAADGQLSVAALNDAVLFLVAPAEVGLAEDYILELCREQGFLPRKIKYMPSVLAIELAIKNNDGFTIGSDLFHRHFPDALRLFRISGTRLSESVAIFWHEGAASHGGDKNSFAARFIETLTML